MVPSGHLAAAPRLNRPRSRSAHSLSATRHGPSDCLAAVLAIVRPTPGPTEPGRKVHLYAMHTMEA